jgi:hypothetical protein
MDLIGDKKSTIRLPGINAVGCPQPELRPVGSGLPLRRCEKILLPGVSLIPAHRDRWIGEALGLPARSRFGEGRAEPLN